MNMKHRVLLLALISILATSCGISNRMYVRTYSDGYWGRWEHMSNNSFSRVGYQGSVDNFIIYTSACHPSQYTFKLEVKGMNVRNNTKTDLKANKWYEYWGTLSFEQNITWQEFALYVVTRPIGHYGGVQKKMVQVKVMKKSSGYIYNVVSDDVGFSITIPWQHSKKIK